MSFNNDVLLDIEPYLDYKDLVNLSLTCKDMDSLVNDVAKQIVTKYQSVDEEKSLKKHDDESWINVLNKLHLLRLPLTFDQLIGDRIAYTPLNTKDSVISANYTRSINDRPVEFTGYSNTAISNHVMRGGKHYATFTADIDLMAYCWFGVMRPIKGLDKKGMNRFFPLADFNLLAYRTDTWESDIHCCFYDCYEGECTWSDWQKAEPYHVKDWKGIEGSLKPEPGESCKVGLYLDLEEGRLIVYKNDQRLGIMKVVSYILQTFALYITKCLTPCLSVYF